jgi:hypothetical protein
MSWRRLLVLTLFTALAFGGTFTCRSNDGDTVIINPTTSPAR